MFDLVCAETNLVLFIYRNRIHLSFQCVALKNNLWTWGSFEWNNNKNKYQNSGIHNSKLFSSILKFSKQTKNTIKILFTSQIPPNTQPKSLFDLVHFQANQSNKINCLFLSFSSETLISVQFSLEMKQKLFLHLTKIISDAQLLRITEKFV